MPIHISTVVMIPKIIPTLVIDSPAGSIRPVLMDFVSLAPDQATGPQGMNRQQKKLRKPRIPSTSTNTPRCGE